MPWKLADCEPQIDGGGSIALLFEEDPVPKNDGSVERESWLRTVPFDEVSDGPVVRSLAAFGRKAVQDCGFGLLQIGQRQDLLVIAFLFVIAT